MPESDGELRLLEFPSLSHERNVYDSGTTAFLSTLE